MADAVIIEATALQDREACFSIRVDVFCDEQNVSREIEFDGLDNQCRHYLAIVDGVKAGTARTRPLNDAEIKLERIAVLSDHRNMGIGRLLVSRALEDAVNWGFNGAILNAQAHTGGFYNRLGFQSEGELFYEAGILHKRMRKIL